MSEGTVVCRRCGVTNRAGDQFCGSCGAFLEWEGDPGEPSAAPIPPGPPIPQAGQSPLAAATVICTSCGTVNPSTRTFCQHCGAVLATGAARGAADQTPVAGTRPTAAEETGGLPFWVPIVAGIGLLAGIGVVLGVILLRPAPPPPQSTATAAASVTFTPTLPPSPAGSAGASGPAASASTSAIESVPLTPSGATASSVVGNREMFNADKAIDGDLTTCWQEGAADETGEWIEVTFAPARLDYVVIYSGFQLSHDAYLGNRRPENVLVSIDGGAPVSFVLADAEQPQRLDVDDTAGATTVRIEVVSTFDPIPTAYPGSPFDDLAISEVRAFGQAGG
jgi:hypothetical protein